MTKYFYNQIVKNLPNPLKLEPYLQQSQIAWKEIVTNIKQIPPLQIAYQQDNLSEIQNLAKEINNKFKKVIVLGVGGSSLGGKTLSAIKQGNKIIFMESIDSQTIDYNLESLDLKNTLFLVISKSGETIETICQTLIVIEKFKQNNIQNFNQNFIFISQDQKNTITKIALEINSKIYFHPADIGGRFSYLTIVGLLPAAICGLDILSIKNSAKQILDNFINHKNNQIVQNITHQLYLFDRGFNNNVIMPYIDSLKDFTDWYRQLWSESLGKNGFGSTPINSMGTIDQHSQLQLYLDGPKDKFFTFITNQDPNNGFPIIDLPNCPTLFGGKNLNDIVNIEQKSTIEMLNQKQLPIRVLSIKTLDEATLSALMMQMFLETIMIAKVKNINPFDQPAVETRKILATEYLQQ